MPNHYQWPSYSLHSSNGLPSVAIFLDPVLVHLVEKTFRPLTLKIVRRECAGTCWTETLQAVKSSAPQTFISSSCFMRPPETPHLGATTGVDNFPCREPLKGGMSAKTTERVNSENFTCVLMGSIIFALEFGCECAMPVTVHIAAHAQKASARARSYPSSTFVSSAVGTCLDAAFTAYINYCSIIQICGVSASLLDNSSSA